MANKNESTPKAVKPKPVRQNSPEKLAYNRAYYHQHRAEQIERKRQYYLDVKTGKRTPTQRGPNKNKPVKIKPETEKVNRKTRWARENADKIMKARKDKIEKQKEEYKLKVLEEFKKMNGYD